MKNQNSFKLVLLGLLAFSGLLYFACSTQNSASQNTGALSGDVASQVYVECMVNYVGKNESTNYAILLVNDFEKPGQLVVVYK